MGIPYPPSALFLLVIFGLVLLIIEVFIRVSKLNERTRALAQQVALLQDRLEAARQVPVERREDAEEVTEERSTESDLTH